MIKWNWTQPEWKLKRNKFLKNSKKSLTHRVSWCSKSKMGNANKWSYRTSFMRTLDFYSQNKTPLSTWMVISRRKNMRLFLTNNYFFDIFTLLFCIHFGLSHCICSMQSISFRYIFYIKDEQIVFFGKIISLCYF